MQGIWDGKEVKKLFQTVEKCKEKNMPIKEAFLSHARAFARKPNSVRNYYYHEVDNLSKDKTRCQKLGINLSLHSKTDITYFSDKEEGFVMSEIDRMRKEGMSVRKACLTLANGDASLMLRYQNKYRNQAPKVKDEGLTNDKVIAFKKPNRALSDSEVQSLFMGLVRLVKKNALLEGEEKYREKLRQANDKLKSLLARIAVQQQEIDKIKESYSLLRGQKEKSDYSLYLHRCDKAKSLREKMQSIKSEEKEEAGNKNL